MPSVGARKVVFAHPSRLKASGTLKSGSQISAQVVGASQYGGPGDPSSGTRGYHGDDLRGKMAFAELGMGTFLGNLPYRAKLKITYNGKSVVAEKLDIGRGGGDVQGHRRSIDLWYETAAAIGFSGLGLVTIEDAGGASLGTAGGGGAASGGGGSFGIGDIIGVLFDPQKAAKLAVDIIALMGRWSIQAWWRWVIAPPWHASQRAVDYYARVEMNDGTRALVTMGFWSIGYAVLHTDLESKQLSGARPSKTPLGRTLGSAKRLAKSPFLTSPKKVKKRTSTKPTPKESSARVDRIRVVSATRKRSVKVVDNSPNANRTGKRHPISPRESEAYRRYLEGQDKEPRSKPRPEAPADRGAGVDSQGASGQRTPGISEPLSK